jgi:hypothetical protein
MVSRLLRPTLAACATLFLVVACGSEQKELFVVPFDAGTEAGDAGATSGDAAEAGAVDPTLGGPCVDDSQCDDQIPCTFDRCDKSIGRCRNVPDDAKCENGIYCDGVETCVARLGCRPGAPVTCQDGDSCTVDRCNEADKSCTRTPRDADGDGDATDQCSGGTDCDDQDPQTSKKRTEICGNGKDDNCNGQVDEQPCSVAEGDSCAAPRLLGGTGTYLVSTAAAKKDHASSCGVTNGAASVDVVLAVVVPPGPPKDLDVWSYAAGTESALALMTTCGVATSEVACARAAPQIRNRVLGRSVAPGTYYLLLTTQAEAAVDVRVDLRDGTTKPANESCTAPEPIATGVNVPFRIVDAQKDLSTGCEAPKGELTYAFTLQAPQDVRIFAQTTLGSGDPVVSLRGADCTSELRCRKRSDAPLFARSLAAGTHVVAISAPASVDGTFLVQLSPPTQATANQTCATAPAAPSNAQIAIDMSAQEDAIPNGCLPGAPSAAYKLDLAVPSDVLVVGRFPGNNTVGAVALNGPGCTPQDLLACSVGSTPARFSRRGLPAGSYRVIVAHELGQPTQLSVFTRPAAAPTTVAGASTCADAFPMPDTGGYFVGDTAVHSADFPAGCDTVGATPNGAKDQLLKLVLPSERRVVMSMNGSQYGTLLNLRQGVACPGTEVQNACNWGGGAQASFLERVLAPGTYYVQVDGFNGAEGPWSLDVRVLAP